MTRWLWLPYLPSDVVHRMSWLSQEGALNEWIRSAIRTMGVEFEKASRLQLKNIFFRFVVMCRFRQQWSRQLLQLLMVAKDQRLIFEGELQSLSRLLAHTARQKTAKRQAVSLSCVLNRTSFWTEHSNDYSSSCKRQLRLCFDEMRLRQLDENWAHSRTGSSELSNSTSACLWQHVELSYRFSKYSDFQTRWSGSRDQRLKYGGGNMLCGCQSTKVETQRNARSGSMVDKLFRMISYDRFVYFGWRIQSYAVYEVFWARGGTDAVVISDDHFFLCNIMMLKPFRRNLGLQQILHHDASHYYHRIV